MAFTLDDLLADGRLTRLFHAGECACALQLWVLQIKTNSEFENRFLYGRLLPYSYASGVWSATDDDRFKEIGEHRAQIIQLNLYLKSADTASLLKHLSNGETLARTSEALGFDLQPSLAARVGAATLGKPLLVRAVAYLLNRDSVRFEELLSPHGAAGAFSASISQADKRALFRLGDHFDVDLAKLIMDELNSATGLNFSSQDSERLGDFELLVFPTLDDSERNLLNVQINRPRYLVHLDPLQLPHYRQFTVQLHLMNARELVHSMIAIIERPENGVLESEFEVPDLLSHIVDGIEIEIHGFHSGDTQGVTSVHLPWLERVTRSAKAAGRLQTAQTVNQGRHGSSSRVGDREADPWVPINRDISALIARHGNPFGDCRCRDFRPYP